MYQFYIIKKNLANLSLSIKYKIKRFKCSQQRNYFVKKLITTDILKKVMTQLNL
jgi:hypothetical protein